MRELHLFAGMGGGILGGMLLGHTCVGAVEINPYCQEVLRARQRDGLLPDFPIWGDITTFDANPWRGKVDIVAGGFPCQDISIANPKAQGIQGARSGLWSEMARVVGEIQPRYVFVENVPALLSRGLHRVLGDLAAMGFDAEWGVFRAADVGAPHLRKRLWILAYSRSESSERNAGAISGAEEKKCSQGKQNGYFFDRSPDGGEEVPHTPSQQVGTTGQSRLNGSVSELPISGPSGLPERDRSNSQGGTCPAASRTGWWDAEPRLGRVVNGGARRVDRIKALGNAQVPMVAALAFTALMERIP